jgi:hypothetical protein
MGRKPITKVRRINLTVDENVVKILAAHRERLIRERGIEVTESDTVRDAIIRTKEERC